MSQNTTSQTSPDETKTSEISIDILRRLALPQYSDDSDKADYGKLLIIAGSRRLPGAAILCARAALRSGCGTVRLACPESIAVAVGAQVPELMVIQLPETKAGTLAKDASTLLATQWEPCDAAVIGPGMDEDEETNALLKTLAVKCPLPAVLDASAIIALEKTKTAFATPRVLTPHLQEMNTLLGSEIAEDLVEREEIVRRTAHKLRAVTLLKGRETLIASPDDKFYRNTAGTRGLGTAGSGDVLAGVIGGLLAQFSSQQIEDGALRAAVWGVHLHALAGEACEKDLGDDGIMASDLISRLPGVLRYLRKQSAPKNEGRYGLRP